MGIKNWSQNNYKQRELTRKRHPVGIVRRNTPKVRKDSQKKTAGRAKKRKNYNNACHKSSPDLYQKIEQYPIVKGCNESWEIDSVKLDESHKTIYDRSHHQTKKPHKQSYLQSYDQKYCS